LFNQVLTRALSRADLPAVSKVVEQTGMFPSEMLPDMVEPFLARSADHRWIVVVEGDAVIGFAYSEPERMTDNTHNLLAIAVTPDRQGQGFGKRLVHAIKAALKEQGGRVLLVETSSLPEFTGARAFYDRLGFAREALIRDFYAEGEDKVLFWRKL
jgi:ribosomal protein S18 acetylase RimI-like enzyme